MKQVININFHGNVVPIEQTAYEILKQYIDSLKNYFNDEPSRDEIINDIEGRVSELFEQKLKSGSNCITDADVEAVKKSIGTPADFAETEDEPKQSTSQENTSYTSFSYNNKKLHKDKKNGLVGGVCAGLANYFNLDPSLVRVIFAISVIFGGAGVIAYLILWIVLPESNNLDFSSIRKKLYRDPEQKVLAGVCSGLANYFNISVWIPRLIFLLPVLSFIFRNHGFSFSFNFTSLIAYIILWLVVPEAKTTSEKLEMKGEKIDINSIKNSVTGDWNDSKEKFAAAGKQMTDAANTAAQNISTFAKQNKNTIADIIGLLVKIFVYFVLGSIAIGLFFGLLGIAFFSFGMFPFKDFILNGVWQNVYAWGTLIFFIAIPIIGMLTWIIRRLTGNKRNSSSITFAFIGMWILGWFFLMMMLSSINKDFKKESTYFTTQIPLKDSNINTLHLVPYFETDVYNRKSFTRFNPFEGANRDTLYIPNIRINLLKSSDANYHIEMTKVAWGNSKNDADKTANSIQYNWMQTDSLLKIDRGIGITRESKFRNQTVVLNVFVPVGKKIFVDERLNNYRMIRFNGFGFDNDRDFDRADAIDGWDEDVEYIMQADGLYELNGTKVGSDSNNDWNENSNGNKINPDIIPPSDVNKIDSMNRELKLQQEKVKDSLKRKKEELENELKKLNARNSNNNIPEFPMATLIAFNPQLF